LVGEYIFSKSIVSDSLLEMIPFDRQRLSVIPLVFCVTDTVYAIK